MSTSKRYHHGNLQVALLRAAGDLLEKEGLEALTLREAARRAGVSHTAPYRHFPDLEALLAALADEGFRMLAADQREAATKAGARGLGEAYVRFALAHPQRFRLMFGGRVSIGRHPLLREAAEKTYEGIASAMAARVPKESARDAAVAAWSLVHGLAMLLLNQRISPEARAGRSEEDFVRQVLGAIRFAGGPAQPPN